MLVTCNYLLQRWMQLCVVLCISLGLFLFTFKSTQFNLIGFLMCLKWRRGGNWVSCSFSSTVEYRILLHFCIIIFIRFRFKSTQILSRLFWWCLCSIKTISMRNSDGLVSCDGICDIRFHDSLYLICDRCLDFFGFVVCATVICINSIVLYHL